MNRTGKLPLPAIPRVEHRRMLRFFQMLPVLLGALVSVFGATALILRRVAPAVLDIGDGPLRMLPITGATFVAAGLALIVAQKRSSMVARFSATFLAIVVAGIGVTVLGEHIMGIASSIHMLGFPDSVAGPGRRAIMAANTAMAFVFFGIGLLLLGRDRRHRGLVSQIFATLTIIIAFTALVGRVFDVTDFPRFELVSGMAPISSFVLLLLGLGLLFSQLERGIPALMVDDGAAGFLSRRLLPGAVVVPFVFAWFGVIGEERGFLGQRLAGSLVSVADMVVFMLLIAWSARVVRALDKRRGELLVLERESRKAAERARAEGEIATAEAEAARAEAERANGAKSDFLAVMSHELRTPLAAIMGYQELLADGITGPVTEAQAQQLGRIKASARHLLSLIDEILTFTRLDAGRETVVQEKVDLDEVIRDACEIAEPLAESKRLAMRILSPGRGTFLETDPVKVRQILVNLLSNAVKFTEKGTVSVEGKVAGDDFLLIVSDTGIGIQEEHIGRIFDPFWQVEQKATRRASGTGLGLTVTKRLANLLGGDVAVASTPGLGTTFTVTLPVKAPHVVSIPERVTRRRAG